MTSKAKKETEVTKLRNEVKELTKALHKAESSIGEIQYYFSEMENTINSMNMRLILANKNIKELYDILDPDEVPKLPGRTHEKI